MVVVKLGLNVKCGCIIPPKKQWVKKIKEALHVIHPSRVARNEGGAVECGPRLGVHKTCTPTLGAGIRRPTKIISTLLNELLKSDIKLVMRRIFVKVTKIS